MRSVPRLAEEVTGPAVDRRWITLAFIALAQLMIALDATIVSIALPSAQHALGATDAERQWVITAYTLAFAGLLLVGGRIADTVGRRRTFVIGLAGFALASAVGGSAGSFLVLLAARAAQGAFAALLAPTRSHCSRSRSLNRVSGPGHSRSMAQSPDLAQRLDSSWAAS